jgi:pimeloyl-ACP methyl ester carboxylesterase
VIDRLNLLAIGGLSLTAGWVGAHLSSPAVRRWRQPSRHEVTGSSLFAATAPARTAAHDPVVLLLHGLTATGISFSRHYDCLPGTVVVPDLLGFGRSLSTTVNDFGRQAHVAAVCVLLEDMGLRERPVVLVGHSMGAVLALHLACELPQVRGVVAVSAPLYDTDAEADAHVVHATLLARLFATGSAAQRVCEWMCAHRRLASFLWPVVAPQWPRPIAAAGVLHTWPAYADSIQGLVINSDYRTALGRLTTREVPVWLLNGADDRVPVFGRADDLAAEFTNLEVEEVTEADHDLPIAQPEFCTRRIAALIATWSPDTADSDLG